MEYLVLEKTRKNNILYLLHIRRGERMIEVEWIVFFLLGAMASYMGFLMGKGS
jgi:hypothetical protein